MKYNQRTKNDKNDKVVDDTSNEETKNSTSRKVKKEDRQIPHSYIMFIVLRIEIALSKKLKPSSRITSSQPSTKMFSFPTVLSGPKLPH